MTEQNFVYVDTNYLKELEEKGKRHDFFEGYIKGIEVAFAFAEELVKNIGNSKDEPQYDFGEYADRLWKIAYERGKREALERTEPTISKMEQVDKDINVRSKDEPQTERFWCATCKYNEWDNMNPKCDECIVGEDKPSNYEPQTDCPWK